MAFWRVQWLRIRQKLTTGQRTQRVRDTHLYPLFYSVTVSSTILRHQTKFTIPKNIFPHKIYNPWWMVIIASPLQPLSS